MIKRLISVSVFAVALIAVGIIYVNHQVAADFDAHQERGHDKHVRVCNSEAGDTARCHVRVIVDRAGGPFVTTLPSGLGPVEFHNAYASQTQAPGKQIIAIVDAYDHPSIASDLATYSKTFGIPNLPTCSGPVTQSATPCFQKVNQSGGTQYPQISSGWALEIALDVEAAHAMCQNCSILLVEASSNSYTNLMAAVDRAVILGATVISNSYGSSEFSGEIGYDAHFDHPGIAITFSSGDAGYGAEYPASSPNVIAVGGTTLLLNADKTYNSELAWSGSGSGCSVYELTKPVWQKDAGCTRRTVTDVSADADPNTGAAVYDSVRYGGRKGWFKVGGTSLAAPLVAGVYALAGGVASGVVGSSVPYANIGNLHDIFTGSNGSCGGSYLCTAGVGYDGPTGLGTPNGLGAF